MPPPSVLRLFQHDRLEPEFVRGERAREAGDAGAENDDVVGLVRRGHQRLRLMLCSVLKQVGSR